MEELLGSCLEGPPESWLDRVEEACRTHPGHGAVLRERFAALLQLMPPSGRTTLPSSLGDFELGERIGGGGMGVVYRARQISLRRDVAIKMIRAERASDPASHERFRREAAAIAKLEHPGILRVHGFGDDGGSPWFAMALHRGVSVATALGRIAGRAPQALRGADLWEAVGGDPQGLAAAPSLFQGSWTQACIEVGLQVARALEHAHGRGVLHRDVKPSNIMLGEDGAAVLIDFGLTRSMDVERSTDDLTRTGAALGTLVYMAPEQVVGRSPVGPLADVYSVGATLHELLTLRPPFHGDSTAALEAAVLRGEPEPLRAHHRGLSQDVETVVLRSMSRRPVDRYASIAELADDLERILTRRPIAARPVGPLSRFVRWCGRQPAHAAALFFFGTALLGIPTGMWWVERRTTGELEAALRSSQASAIEAAKARADAEGALERERDALASVRESESNLQRAMAAAQESEAESRDVLGFLLSLFSELPPLESSEAPATAVGVLQAGAASIGTRTEMSSTARARVQLALGGALRHANEHGVALGMLESAAAVFADRDDVISRRREAMALDGAARCLRMVGRWEDAVERAHRARDIALEAFDPSDPAVVEHLAYAAEVLVGTPKASSALAPREQLLRHLQRHRPEDGIALAKARAGLGQAFFEAGRYVEADREFQVALAELRELVPATDHDRIQLTLRSANIPLLGGDLARAATLFEEGRDLARAAYGADDELALAAEASLADVHARRGDLGAAVAAYEALLPRMRARFAQTIMYGATIRSFQNALLAQGRTGDVVVWAKRDRWSESLEAIYGVSHPAFGAVHERLTGCALAASDFEFAVHSLEQYIAYAKTTEHSRGPKCRALFTIGQLYAGPLSDPERARAAFEEVCETVGDEPLRQSPAPGVPEVELGLHALEQLAGLARRAGAQGELASWEDQIAARRKIVERHESVPAKDD